MEKDEKLLITLNISDLKEIIRETMTELLVEKNKSSNNEDSKKKNLLLTRKEVAELFQVSTVSLDKWRSAGLLPDSIKMAGRVYYLKSEIDQMISERKRRR